MLQSPSGLLLLLASGEVVTLNLIADVGLLREFKSTNKGKSSLTNQSSLDKLIAPSFKDHVKQILTPDVSQPILKLDHSVEPTPKAILELLMNATKVLREQYFTKHDNTRQEIQKRVKVLQLLKEQQQQEMMQLQQETEKIRANAERLAERYEDICDKQQSLFKRTQEVVRAATMNSPHAAAVERDFELQIQKINAVAKVLAKNLTAAKQRIQSQEKLVGQKNVENKTKQAVLPPKAQATIMDVIMDL